MAVSCVLKFISLVQWKIYTNIRYTCLYALYYGYCIILLDMICYVCNTYVKMYFERRNKINQTKYKQDHAVFPFLSLSLSVFLSLTHTHTHTHIGGRLRVRERKSQRKRERHTHRDTQWEGEGQRERRRRERERDREREGGGGVAQRMANWIREWDRQKKWFGTRFVTYRCFVFLLM